MITRVNSTNTKINFGGTTIIKKEGGSFLNKEIIKAVHESTLGLCETRLNGYSLVVVSDVFNKEEANFLSSLREKNIPHVNFSKVFDRKTHSLEEIKEMIRTIAKTGLI